MLSFSSQFSDAWSNESHLSDMCSTEEDLEVVAPLVVAYYNWLSGNGGSDPETLLARPMSPSARQMLLERIDDVNFVYGLTAPLRNAARYASAKPLATDKTRGQRGGLN